MNQFPPEADGEFSVVSVKEISAWRRKLNDRFGFDIVERAGAVYLSPRMITVAA